MVRSRLDKNRVLHVEDDPGFADLVTTRLEDEDRRLDVYPACNPQPPDSLRKYLAEDVPKQDDANLRALQDWIDDLLEYRQDVAAEDIDAGEGESIEAVEESSGGTVVIKKVSCGKDNCTCQSGDLHGPYKYIVRRQGDSLDWEYEGAVTD